MLQSRPGHGRAPRAALPALALAAALTLTACQLTEVMPDIKLTPLGRVAPAVSGAANPIRIGATLTLSGSGRVTGGALRDGYYLWARTLNAAGGIGGRPVEIVVYDDEGNPDRTALLYEKLMSDDQVDLLLGPSSPRTAAAAAAAAARRRRPVLTLDAVEAPAALEAPAAAETPAEGAAPAPLPWSFSLHRPGLWFGGAGLELARERGYRRVAIIFDPEEPEVSLAGLVAARVRELGLTTVFQRTYPPDGSGLGQLLEEVRAAEPDVLLLALKPVAARAVVRRAREAGLAPHLVELLGASAPPNLAEDLGSAANGLMTEVRWHASTVDGHVSAFVTAYRELFGEAPGYTAAAGYALGQVLQDAAARSSSLEPAGLQAALAAGGGETLVGPWRPDGAGYNVAPAGSGVVVQYQKEQQVVVFPAEKAAAQPVLPFAWEMNN